MKKKYSLVTGCAGFIGSHMVDFLLKKKHVVFGIDNLNSGKIKNLKNAKINKNFLFIKGDLNKIFDSKNIIKKIKKIDYVYHFAGHGELIPSIERPLEYFKNNAYNTVKLLDFVKNNYDVKKFVYAASSSCYGVVNGRTNEEDKIKTEHPYAFSKYIGELACLHWAKVFKIPTVSIRIFNAYGPRSRTTNVYGAVIGVFLKQKLSNYPLTIVGDGLQKRDFLYISDLCEAFYLASKSKIKNDIFNLGFGKSKSVNYLSSLISKNRKFIPWRPGEPKFIEANISKITKTLGWKPKINLDRGMKYVLKEINYWKKAPLWTKSKITKATSNWMKFLKD